MNPLLKSGDEMKVIPCKKGCVEKGDVVVFRPDNIATNVVHRVVSMDSRGIITRGDNNFKVDSFFLRHDNIIGRVIHAKRDGKKIVIYGGRKGFLIAKTLLFFKRFDSLISQILRPFYYRIAQIGPFNRFFKTRVICFTRPYGVEMQLLMGSKVIGRIKSGQDKWRIRRPFRLFVNEASLPINMHNNE